MWAWRSFVVLLLVLSNALATVVQLAHGDSRGNYQDAASLCVLALAGYGFVGLLWAKAFKRRIDLPQMILAAILCVLCVWQYLRLTG